MTEEPKTEREARIAGKIVDINEGEIGSHLDRMVLRSVEDTCKLPLAWDSLK